MTHTRCVVSRFRFLHASAQCFVLFHRLCFVFFSPITASCSRSVWGCLPRPTRCFDYRFVLRASGTHRFVGRWCFIQNVLNVCSERNVSFSFSIKQKRNQNHVEVGPCFLLGLYRPASGPCGITASEFVCGGHAGRLDRPFQLKVRETWAKRKMLSKKPCHSTCNHRSVRSSTLYTSVRSGILSRIAVRSHMLLFSVFVLHWCTK